MFSDIISKQTFLCLLIIYHYITIERINKDKCSRKGVTTKEKYFINFCSVAAQINRWSDLYKLRASEAREEKKYNFWSHRTV